ncbi:metallophosphoesterase [Oceanospirillum beijerinckii]|uniref:metallophosphoesterase n=1 Tax=Oceanospirillum beijerinckii TaxID=64976 RepID=UPI0004166CDE|nr:metallophosphoesterase [Oceanospirillum beijerinckii]MAC48609.1 hypothetical protein [Oceanospirillum sp.]
MSVVIQYQSDLHLEFEHGFISHTLPDVNADVIVLAGDIGIASRLHFDWVLEQTRGIPTVFILGNHEPYRSCLQLAQQEWKEAMAGSNVHVLENEVVELCGVRFIGSTLWSDFQLFNEDPSIAQDLARMRMNDFRLVEFEHKGLKRMFTPEDARNMHLESMDFFNQELSKPFSGPTVVVSHHAPSIESLPVSYRDEPIRAGYASNLEHFIELHQPDAWIHGHLHNTSDYCIGKTRVLCNPRGYFPRSVNPDFDPEIVLEL